MANDVKVLIKSLYDGKGVRDAVKGMRDLTKGTDEFKKQSKDLFGGVTFGLTSMIAGIASVGFALKKAFDFGAEGAGITRLEDSFENLTSAAGTAGDALLTALDKAALGTVSNKDLILSTNRAMMLGLGADVNQLSNLMEVAAFRGRAMGVSTTQAFNDIVTGVGRGSPMILDNLGIIVDAQNTYDQYATSIGKASSELTKQEKTTALLSRVLEEGNRQMEEAGGLVDDTAASYERLGASTKNFFDELKQGASETFKPAVDVINDWVDALGNSVNAENELVDAARKGIITQEEANLQINKMTWTSYSAADAMEWLGKQTDESGKKFKEIDESTESFDRNLKRLPASLDSTTESLEDNAEALKEQSNAYKNLLSSIDKIQSVNERFTDDEERRAEKIKEIEADKVRAVIEGGDKQKELKQDLAELERDIATERGKKVEGEDEQFAKTERLHDMEVRRLDILKRISEERDNAAVKQIEYNDKIAELEQESTEAIEDKEKAYKELLYAQLESQATAESGVGGADITQKEFEFLQNMKVELGLVDAASANAAIAISEDANSIYDEFQKVADEGVGSVQTALDAVVHGSPYVARIQIETVGGVPNISGSIGGTQRAPTVFNPRSISSGHSSGHGYAEGGQFVIPDQYGYEGFNMGGMATASGGETVTITPRGKGGGMVLNLNIANIRSLSDIDYLVQEVQRKIG